MNEETGKKIYIRENAFWMKKKDLRIHVERKKYSNNKEKKNNGKRIFFEIRIIFWEGDRLGSRKKKIEMPEIV